MRTIEELKAYRDTMSCIKFAKSMKVDGIDNATIAKYTDLSIQEIEKLRI